MKNTKFALWVLVNRSDVRVEGDCLFDGDDLVFTGVTGLMLDGYVDTRGVITDLGRRVAARPLSSATIATAMRNVQNGGPLSRYIRLRLLHEGLLEETPGGLRRAKLKSVTFRVTEDQELLIRMMLAATSRVR